MIDPNPDGRFPVVSRGALDSRSALLSASATLRVSGEPPDTTRLWQMKRSV
jgi:hypothetical protein